MRRHFITKCDKSLQLFFYKQSIFDPRPEKFLSFPPQKLFSNCLADGLLTSIVIQTF